MEFRYWHLAVVVGLVVLVVWGVRVSRRTTLAALAATLTITSGLLLNTLVLDEAHLAFDVHSRVEDAALIGIPALLGVGLGVLAVKRTGGRQA